MGKNIIFYFSGTGNSLAAAKIIARQLDDFEIVFMKGAFTPAAHYERVGFGCPATPGARRSRRWNFLKTCPYPAIRQTMFFRWLPATKWAAIRPSCWTKS